jgi:hypothetical protein
MTLRRDLIALLMHCSMRFALMDFPIGIENDIKAFRGAIGTRPQGTRPGKLEGVR